MSWQGVAVLVTFVAGAVTAAALGETNLAMALAGAAAGNAAPGVMAMVPKKKAE